MVSILLAFAIQAWWEGRRERTEEEAMLVGLLADFSVSRQELEDAIRVHEDFQDRLIALDTASTSQLASVPFEQLDAYGRALQGSRTFDAQDATLDAAIASGTLDTLRDVQLRETLAEWKALVDDTAEEAADFREASAQVLEQIAVLGGPWIADPATMAGLPNSPSSLNARSHFRPPDLVAVGADSELKNLLRTKRFRGLLYLSFLAPLVSHADSVIALIDANLD